MLIKKFKLMKTILPLRVVLGFFTFFGVLYQLVADSL